MWCEHNKSFKLSFGNVLNKQGGFPKLSIGNYLDISFDQINFEPEEFSLVVTPPDFKSMRMFTPNKDNKTYRLLLFQLGAWAFSFECTKPYDVLTAPQVVIVSDVAYDYVIEDLFNITVPVLNNQVLLDRNGHIIKV